MLLWMMTTNMFLIYVYKFITWYERKAAITICESVDGMKRIMATTTLDLYHGGLDLYLNCENCSFLG